MEGNLNKIPQHESEPTKRPKTCQSQMPSYCVKTDAATSNQLDLQIARLFYACNILFNLAEQKEFNAMTSLLRNQGTVKPQTPGVTREQPTGMHQELQ